MACLKIFFYYSNPIGQARILGDYCVREFSCLVASVWIKGSLPSSSRNSEPAFPAVSDYSWQPGDEGDVEVRWGPSNSCILRGGGG